MKNRRTVLKWMAGAAAVTIAPPYVRQASAAGEILVGFHGPITGPASWVGLGGRDGSLMAFDEINAAGGINGNQLRLIPYDDGGKASEAEAITKKMIESDKVFAILGGGLTGAAAVAGAAASRAKVPYLNFTSPKIADLKSRWVFTGATLDSRDIAENEAIFVGEYLKPKKVAVLSSSDEYPQFLADTVTKIIRERYGIETVGQQKFNRGDTDFSSQWLALRQTSPDYILIFGLYVEASRAIRQARELGIKTPIMGEPSLMNSGLLTVAGSAAEGLTVAYIPPYFNGDPAKDMVEFEARYKKKYPSYPADRPNYVDVFGYGAAYVLAEGLKRAGADRTAKQVVESLETLKDFKPSDSWPDAVNILQPMSFDQGHNGNRQLSYYKVAKGKFERIQDFKPSTPTTKFPANGELDW